MSTRPTLVFIAQINVPKLNLAGDAPYFISSFLLPILVYLDSLFALKHAKYYDDVVIPASEAPMDNMSYYSPQESLYGNMSDADDKGDYIYLTPPPPVPPSPYYSKNDDYYYPSNHQQQQHQHDQHHSSSSDYPSYSDYSFSDDYSHDGIPTSYDHYTSSSSFPHNHNWQQQHFHPSSSSSSSSSSFFQDWLGRRMRREAECEEGEESGGGDGEWRQGWPESWAIQGHHLLPTSTTPTVVIGNSRSLGEDQASLYKQVEESLAAVGVEGHECLLRAVCEAQSGQMLKLNLIGHLLTTFLSPVEEDDEGGQWVSSYQKASQLGREGANCPLAFPRCLVSVLDIFKFGKRGKTKNAKNDKSIKKEEDISDNHNTIPVS
ncbi:hypothetical protein Pcinc_016347 [Petrolisthes cinctipes]|uniref:Uncharacterized protein n=1 Tax=Petrolisthes cinctipes TaxID=88211 RepID=A0AAE1FSH9_PETCI|nr:hypothetical protein Pcinc_016347 [Petrolisthes cinctipes]